MLHGFLDDTSFRPRGIAAGTLSTRFVGSGVSVLFSYDEPIAAIRRADEPDVLYVLSHVAYSKRTQQHIGAIVSANALALVWSRSGGYSMRLPVPVREERPISRHLIREWAGLDPDLPPIVTMKKGKATRADGTVVNLGETA